MIVRLLHRYAPAAGEGEAEISVQPGVRLGSAEHPFEDQHSLRIARGKF